MRVAFVDESGSPSPSDGPPFFVVAALVGDTTRAIELHIKRARRSLRLRSPLGELKAARSRPAIIRRFLESLSHESCDIYAVVVDKRNLPDDEAEGVYRAAVGRLILRCVRQHPELHVYLDKRYTSRRQRIELEQTVRQTIAAVPEHVVLIEQVDSAAYPGLQAADFVAWALAQKHNLKEFWAVEIIARLIRVEEVVAGTELAAPPGGR